MVRALGVLSGVVALLLGVGCAGMAGMVAGSPAWFENQRADVEPLAATDLDCKAKPITFKPVSSDDYREVEATGCDKKVSYKLVKVAMISKWVKAGDVSAAH